MDSMEGGVVPAVVRSCIVREPELLGHIFDRAADLAAAFSHVLVGPGDDCALIATGARTLLKVDSVIEGVHFARGTPVDRIAYKAIARTVSDIAAMAGRPTAALAACVLPTGMPASTANELFDATSRHARHFGCPLVGGDIASNDGPLTLTITVVGTPHEKVLPLRSHARPGDGVYVTGALGGSLGKDALGRHLSFTPRLAEAEFLANTLDSGLHAMMDLSDGLGIDGGRMALASGVSMVIDERRVAVHADAAGIGSAIGDGEDYELLFTVAAGCEVPSVCPTTGTTITRIGEVFEGSGVWLRTRSGEVLDIARKGFAHR